MYSRVVSVICFPSQAGYPGQDLPPFTEKHSDIQKLNQPCILTFDSLCGPSNELVQLRDQILREYLTCEWNARMVPKGLDSRTFTSNCIPGLKPQVMQQQNTSDCGLFMLQFIESFIRDPISDYSNPYLEQWFRREEVQGKRSKIAGLIRQLAEEQNLGNEYVFPDLALHSHMEILSDTDDMSIDEGENLTESYSYSDGMMIDEGEKSSSDDEYEMTNDDGEIKSCEDGKFIIVRPKTLCNIHSMNDVSRMLSWLEYFLGFQLK